MTQSKAILSAVFAVVTVLMVPNSFATQGTETGNGGDPIGLEFTSAYLNAVQTARSQIPEVYEQLKSLPLPQDLSGFRIVVVDTSLLVQINGTTQDSVAKNSDQSSTIWIRRSKWNQIGNHVLREGIALHEVLGLIGKEATGLYSVSGAYVAALGISSQDLVNKFSSETTVFVVDHSTVNKVFGQEDTIDVNRGCTGDYGHCFGTSDVFENTDETETVTHQQLNWDGLPQKPVNGHPDHKYDTKRFSGETTGISGCYPNIGALTQATSSDFNQRILSYLTNSFAASKGLGSQQVKCDYQTETRGWTYIYKQGQNSKQVKSKGEFPIIETWPNGCYTTTYKYGGLERTYKCYTLF